MTYQKKLSNGAWFDIPEDHALQIAVRVACQERVYCPTTHAKTGFLHFATGSELLQFLAAHPGREISTGSDWYDSIRAKPAPRVPRTVALVKCDCGHAVPREAVMSASLGTSCPDCYDRMSG